MNIIEVNFTDLMGKRYNGYDLHKELNKKGHYAVQIVKKKTGNLDSVISLEDDFIEDNLLLYTEKKLSLQNVLFLYGKKMMKLSNFLKADIVHYHISYNNMLSLLDMPQLLQKKKSIWTFHDLWPVTGRCIHPMECNGWKKGCQRCERISETPFDMSFDNASMMWNIKKDMFSKVNLDIIVPSFYMKRFLIESPMTQHIKHIHVIPFGIRTEMFILNKEKIRLENQISREDFVIGFRADDNPIKGCKYIYNILRNLVNKRIIIATVGGGMIPEDIKNKFRIIDYGWQNDEKIMAQFYNLCDVFIMPSEAESFGMMAIEAMASATPVICFKGTVVEELIYAPKCGIAVNYRDSYELQKAVRFLIDNEEERLKRAELSRKIAVEKYRFYDYVEQHITVYKEILERNRK